MGASFHPEAQVELEEAQAWYEQRSPLAAAGFLDEISLAIRRMSDGPFRYPIAVHGTRRMVLTRFPFIIYYRASDGGIVIVAVAHQSRKPGYWVSRTASDENR
jgi:plasmid stabilization system protein ParE